MKYPISQLVGPRSIIIAFVITCIVLIVGSFFLVDTYFKGLGYGTKHADLARAIGSFDEISTLMRPALSKYRASRVAVFRLHSDNNADLSSMTTFSISVANIVSQPGVSVDLPGLTNLPASMFAGVLPNIIVNEPSLIVTKNLPTSSLKELLENRQTQAALFITVNDIKGNVVGMLMMGWVLLVDVPEGADYTNMLADLHEESEKISKYFGLSPLDDKK